jgi:lysophospholipase
LIQAPFLSDLAEAPDGAEVVWRIAPDGVRLRVGLWPAEGATATVFLFPGRTEYIEKYGRVIADLVARGYAVAAIDWRGQGMSDRLADDEQLGHVLAFQDYQKDVAALLASARAAGLPERGYLLAHSMGGCIGLRALIEGLQVRRAVFSAPMWGIYVEPRKRALATILPGVARLLGQGLRYTPSTRETNYATDTEFQSGFLTSDPDHYAYFEKHALTEPRLALGGPSLHWFSEANREMRALARLPRPELPVLTFVGDDELIVSVPAIQRMHANWPSGELRVIPGAKHELMMEAPDLRRQFMDVALEFLDADVG